MKLPALFQEIVEHDRRNPAARRIVSLSAYRDWKGRRLLLTRAAERFVQRQRGGE